MRESGGEEIIELFFSSLLFYIDEHKVLLIKLEKVVNLEQNKTEHQWHTIHLCMKSE